MFDPAEFDTVRGVIDTVTDRLRQEYPTETGLAVNIDATAADEPQQVMTSETVAGITGVILAIPNGARIMSPDIEGLVQTSNNLGIAETKGDTVSIICMARSSVPAEQEETIAMISAAAAAANAQITVLHTSPAWAYRVDSSLRDSLVAAYTAMYGSPPVVSVIHAGLECGMFA